MSIIDRIIEYFSPETAVRRRAAKVSLELLKRRFDGASQLPRFSEWRRSGTSADAAALPGLATLRNGSRDLTRNNPWAERALTIIQTNVVGTGIRANISATKRLKNTWRAWALTRDMDYEGRADLFSMQHLCIRAIAESGEVLIRRRWRSVEGDPRRTVPFQIQMLEPDYIDESKTGKTEDGNEIKSGIEFNPAGRPVAYHLREQHPGDASSMADTKSYRVSADDVIHAFDQRRAGQTRGYPWCAPAIRRLRDFDGFEDAQLVRQKLAACFTAFVHDATGAGAGGITGLGPNSPTEAQLEYLQPGVVEWLPPGKDVKFPTPPGAENYSEYTTSVLRGIAAAYGITYEALTGDYAKVNFSAGRMGWIEMSRSVARWQALMRVQLLDPIAAWFLQAMQAPPKTEIKWLFPRREMVDPTREIPALISSIRAGLTSLQRAQAAHGYDSDEILTEIAEDTAALDKLGIVLDIDPRHDKKEANGDESGT